MLGVTAVAHFAQTAADASTTASTPSNLLSFALRTPGARRGICLVTAQGARRITGPAPDHAPAWAKDGAHLAFARDISAADAVDVMTAAADGRHVRDLTKGYGMFNTDPAWSPSGRQIVFAVSDHGGALAVMNADGTDKRAIVSTTTGLELESPSWSSDGQWIVYSADVGLASPNRGIYVVRPDGSDKHLVQEGGFDPQWSPNGKKIAYALGHAPDRSRGIAVMNADGSGSERLLSRSDTTHPRWSPDGRWIAYTLRSRKRWDVYVIAVTGQRRRLAVVSRRGAYDPAWRPPSLLGSPPRQPCA